MRIEIVCSDRTHPVWPRLEAWVLAARDLHDAALVTSSRDLVGGDLLFLVSCGEHIGAEIRARYRTTLVLHASDLPEGRGWSPHIWQILEGRRDLCVSLLEAADPVDSGPIWAQVRFTLEGHELHDEISEKVITAELHLISEVVDGAVGGDPRPQADRTSTYYRRRTPEDSRVDPAQSLESQFDMIRVADPDRYPAFFELRGHRYLIKVIKADDEPS